MNLQNLYPLLLLLSPSGAWSITWCPPYRIFPWLGILKLSLTISFGHPRKVWLCAAPLCFFVCFPDLGKVFNKPLLCPEHNKKLVPSLFLSRHNESFLNNVQYFEPVQQKWKFSLKKIYQVVCPFCALKHKNIFGQPGINKYQQSNDT